MKTCTQCSNSFEVTEEDLRFLDLLSPVILGKKIPLPEPTLCPQCRQQRRMAFGNQINLFKRKCDLTGKDIITNYHPSSPHQVYAEEVWFSDQWDPLQYGRDFDFTRPFFEQYRELSLAVPRPALQRAFQFDENSDYTNYSGMNRNSYLIFDSDENENCYYSYSINNCRDVIDCYRVRKSELCYQCLDCINCYGSAYLQDCDNCSESYFLKSCIGVKNSMMCVNLKNKEYHVDNKPVSKEQFENFKGLLLSSSKALENALKHFQELKAKYPQKYLHGVNNENVSGDYLNNSKDAYHCYDSDDLWDCRYVHQAFMPVKNTMDTQEVGGAEKMYECAFGGYDAQNCHFSTHSLGASEGLQYCWHCPHSKDLFGCSGLRQKQYCILNKQYSKEEYGELVPRIIEHMKKTGEYGEFFPIAHSPHAYNDVQAQEYFPLTKEEALAKGYAWREKDVTDYKPATMKSFPENISEVTPEICQEILACKNCGRNYKIIVQELQSLKNLRMPLPSLCFYCRHSDRMQMRNPRALHQRTCDQCAAPIMTTYSPDRPEKIFCESCYAQSLS